MNILLYLTQVTLCTYIHTYTHTPMEILWIGNVRLSSTFFGLSRIFAMYSKIQYTDDRWSR